MDAVWRAMRRRRTRAAASGRIRLSSMYVGNPPASTLAVIPDRYARSIGMRGDWRADTPDGATPEPKS